MGSGISTVKFRHASAKPSGYRSETISSTANPDVLSRDELARQHAATQPVSDNITTLHALQSLLAREKAELRARASIRQQLDYRCGLWKAQEAERRAQRDIRNTTARVEAQRREAERVRARNEEEKIKRDAHFKYIAERKAQEEALAQAALQKKQEEEEAAKITEETKKAEEAKNIQELARLAREAEEMKKAQIEQLQMEDIEALTKYLIHLHRGGQWIPDYHILLMKWYTVAHTDAALMKILDNLQEAAKQEVQTEAALSPGSRQTSPAAVGETAGASTRHTPASIPLRAFPMAPLPPQSDSLALFNTSKLHPTMTDLVDHVLRQVCIEARHSEQSRSVEVTVDVSPTLKEMTNSNMRLSVSLSPLPSHLHPVSEDILAAQLTNVIKHLRTAAMDYGAQCVSHIRFQGSSPSEAGQIGTLTAHLVQLKEMSPFGPVATPVMQRQEPYHVGRRHLVPCDILPRPVPYEIVVASL